ncbi:MAG: DUF3592 domain-containing protein [Segetibacter sp.]|nr:DUF3592 domain-containing protein [Segetibacter sp.]
MYKTAIILYLVCFFSYILFSRIPDYFEGEFIEGVVTKAGFSSSLNQPQLVVDYKAGSETFQFKTNTWFLTTYKSGQKVTVIYDPSNPSQACMFTFIGYWLRWSELLFSIFFFIVLFKTAVFITGKNITEPLAPEDRIRKRKYKD